jgi:hypothetical protein
MSCKSCGISANEAFGMLKERDAKIKEMLTALKSVVDRLSVVIESDAENGHKESESDVSAYLAAKAVIAKAEGRA